MKTRYIIIGAVISLLAGIIITAFSFETIPSETPENLPEGMTPITPEVGRTTNPVGPYLIVASILVLVGVGIYLLVNLLKSKIRK